MKNMKTFFGNISPFNNRTDMPKPVFIIKKLLAYLLCNMGGMIVGTAIVVLIHYPLGLDPLKGEAFTGYPALGFTILNYLLPTLCIIPYWHFIEKKKLSEMYVRKGGCYLAGCLVGAGLLLPTVGIVLLTGNIKMTGLTEDPDLAAIALNGGVYIFQSAREEFLCRGLAFSLLKDKLGVPAAFALSTAAFTIPHLASLNGAGTAVIAVSVLNLVLISAVFTLVMLITGSLWTACGAHFLWNFFLGNIFGLTVSGIGESSPSLISAESVGDNIINGSIFGIEGSIVTTVILALFTTVLCFIKFGKPSVKFSGERRMADGIQ